MNHGYQEIKREGVKIEGHDELNGTEDHPMITIDQEIAI